MNDNETTITLYENEIPAFVGDALDTLYGNIFSSLLQYRTYGWNPAQTSTYIARTETAFSAIFLFTRKKGKVQVLNENIRIPQQEMQRFTSFIFMQYPEVDIIAFKAVETDAQKLAFPHQRFNLLEDITLALPADAEAYRASLGKNTRRNIKRYTDRLVRSFPSMEFHVHEREEIEPQLIRQLIAFNHERMAGKHITSVIDETETQRIIALVRSCGLVGTISINGRLAGGAVSFRVGSNYFLNVLAHDPRYDDYWVGFLCCYRTIGECIARGGKEFHFLWGRYDYKFVLGAVRRDLDNVIVYRSRAQQLFHADLALHAIVHNYQRRVKVWAKYENTPGARFVRHTVGHVREWKHRSADLLWGRKPVFLQTHHEN